VKTVLRVYTWREADRAVWHSVWHMFGWLWNRYCV